ncbi:type II toxin-antitoxin system HigB family toxin [Algoriphagus antarcticus]|uniref:mRNA interferase HigB n=1 Tax=Algoriphagus antarcticus TaxID=238540 RepID=A0A3E0DLT7_9BACT|nr:type II toxin-antitoxin system HigB family toxin [Algoriphagus antarcticus]REG82747.1 mRNA interferase HigB [Algoriphagus antarcticus]
MFNIITRRTLLHYATNYPNASNALFEWYHEFEKLEINSFNELKRFYNSASLVKDDRVVFNISGNKFRLVVRIVFEYKVVQIKWFGTHKERSNKCLYDKLQKITYGTHRDQNRSRIRSAIRMGG